MNEVLTTKQVAEILNVNNETVARMLRSGALKGFKVGGYSKRGHWRVSQDDLEAFINNNNQ